VYEGSFSPTSSPTFVVVCVLDDSHSNGSEEESKHGFDLHFLYGQGCWAVFMCFFFFLLLLFGHLPFKKLCSVHLPISSLGH
jgi:hypothetical protein